MPELTLDAEHVYRRDGVILPGVTTIIRESSLMGFMPNDPWYMERGTAIHQATAFYDKGTLDEGTVDPRIQGYLEAWKKFRADTGYVPAFIEKSLCHPIYQYCGTLDRDGLDLKSGAFCVWHGLQAGSYYDLQDSQEKDLLPAIAAGWRTIYLQEDGAYKVKSFNRQELRDGLKVFLSALHLYQWRKNNKLLKEDV